MKTKIGRLKHVGVAALCGAAILTSTAVEAVDMFQPQITGMSLVLIRSERREGWRRVAVLAQPWFYCSRKTGDLYAVPGGYVTDFASIPGTAKMFFTPFGDWAEAAVIHDWLYDVGAPGRRVTADELFGEAMVDQGVKNPRRWLMNMAVRTFGIGSYRRAEKREADEWKTHFVDRMGKPAPPPFAQPGSLPVFKRNFDCKRLDVPVTVLMLQGEYLEQYPGAVLQ